MSPMRWVCKVLGLLCMPSSLDSYRKLMEIFFQNSNLPAGHQSLSSGREDRGPSSQASPEGSVLLQEQGRRGSGFLTESNERARGTLSGLMQLRKLMQQSLAGGLSGQGQEPGASIHTSSEQWSQPDPRQEPSEGCGPVGLLGWYSRGHHPVPVTRLSQDAAFVAPEPQFEDLGL